jgi:formylglycine-generating enzyme required for sulfatase activity
MKTPWLAIATVACATVLATVLVSSSSTTPASAGVSAASEWTEPFTGMIFVTVPAGRFVMGSPVTERDREVQELQHTVEISRPVQLGKFEVTQAQWQRVMGSNPAWFRADGDTLPVENVTWFEVQDFLSRLSARSPGNRFRLPTEAEWEYACRAGTTAAYATGRTISTESANYDGRPPGATDASSLFRGKPAPVGSFPANAWGLHDMHGNVWEWTDDWHCPYAPGPQVDPKGLCQSSLRVIRGGSWYFRADSARCALRYTHRPQDRGFSLGFRLVRIAAA